MAKIRPEQIPDTMRFLQVDLPALLLTVGKIDDTDEYWEEVINGCNAVYQKHTNGFAKRMLQAFVGYLEEQGDKMRKANDAVKLNQSIKQNQTIKQNQSVKHNQTIEQNNSIKREGDVHEPCTAEASRVDAAYPAKEAAP